VEALMSDLKTMMPHIYEANHPGDNEVFDLVDEGGQELNLFDSDIDLYDRSISRPLSEEEIFKTGESGNVKLRKSNTANIHNALMVAGFTPGIGNIADFADALLYGLEGEFGMAALSVASIAPFAGQYIASQRMLKAAKESGEEIFILYRGVDKWYPGQMVKNGMHVSPGSRVGPHFRPDLAGTKDMKAGDLFYTSAQPQYAANYGRFEDSWNMKTGVLLEFHVPKSYIKKIDGYDMHGNRMFKDMDNPASPGHYHNLYEKAIIFDGGIPKEFLNKVYKYGDEVTSFRNYKLTLSGPRLELTH
jgi:hypothetical protein